MSNTSSDLPVCVHCGTPRPADETLCPKCGEPWIDVSVEDTAPAGAAATAAIAAAAQASSTNGPPPPPPNSQLPDDTGEFGFDDWTLPPEPSPSRARWLIPLILLIAVIALWVLVFVNRDGGTTTSSVVAADTTTTLVTTTTLAETTTITEVTTTSSSTTTTTVAYPAADSWEPVGDPIPTPELGLKASGIGPISIGTSITDSAGALVASLGTAEMAGFDSELCRDAEWYWLDWGDLRGIFDGYSQDATFIAYRYGGNRDGVPDPILETLSGIRLGDTVEALQATYTTYTVSFEVIEEKDYFRLSESGDLLLWGPVSSTEPQGIVEGIFSPDPCQNAN